MTLDEAQRVADLLVTLKDAAEFAEAFEDGKRAFIAFEDVVDADTIRAEGKRGGWQGAIRMERSLAIEMMRWLENRAINELAKLGAIKE